MQHYFVLSQSYLDHKTIFLNKIVIFTISNIFNFYQRALIVFSLPPTILANATAILLSTNLFSYFISGISMQHDNR